MYERQANQEVARTGLPEREDLPRRALVGGPRAILFAPKSSEVTSDARHLRPFSESGPGHPGRQYRSALWGVAEAADILQSLAEQADIVFVGLDEAGDVWGCRTVDDVRRLLPQPSELVVKDGAREAVAFTGSQVVRVPAPVIEVVEPVGAGDAFAAAYLAARHHGRDPEDALRWGHALAGAVLQVLGDHAVAMDRTRLEELVRGEGVNHGA